MIFFYKQFLINLNLFEFLNLSNVKHFLAKLLNNFNNEIVEKSRCK